MAEFLVFTFISKAGLYQRNKERITAPKGSCRESSPNTRKNWGFASAAALGAVRRSAEICRHGCGTSLTQQHRKLPWLHLQGSNVLWRGTVRHAGWESLTVILRWGQAAGEDGLKPIFPSWASHVPAQLTWACWGYRASHRALTKLRGLQLPVACWRQLLLVRRKMTSCTGVLLWSCCVVYCWRRFLFYEAPTPKGTALAIKKCHPLNAF